MSTFATREELNGLGLRLNAIGDTVAGHREAMETSKEDRRDLWKAIANSRAEDARIEGTVNKIARDVAKQNVIFLIINGIIVAVIVKFLGV